MDRFSEFLKIIRKSVEMDPWVQNQSLESFFDELQDEVNELKKAITKGDRENLTEELGDVLYDWAHLSLIAEKYELLKFEQIIEKIIKKVHDRKPFLFDGTKEITLDEAIRLWKEGKESQNI